MTEEFLKKYSLDSDEFKIEEDMNKNRIDIQFLLEITNEEDLRGVVKELTNNYIQQLRLMKAIQKEQKLQSHLYVACNINSLRSDNLIPSPFNFQSYILSEQLYNHNNYNNHNNLYRGIHTTDYHWDDYDRYNPMSSAQILIEHFTENYSRYSDSKLNDSSIIQDNDENLNGNDKEEMDTDKNSSKQ